MGRFIGLVVKPEPKEKTVENKVEKNNAKSTKK